MNPFILGESHSLRLLAQSLCQTSPLLTIRFLDQVDLIVSANVALDAWWCARHVRRGHKQRRFEKQWSVGAAAWIFNPKGQKVRADGEP